MEIMKNTVFFGNGLNRISKQSVSWNDLLDSLKASSFAHEELPNTMVYERIFLSNSLSGEKNEELRLKEAIADKLKNE